MKKFVVITLIVIALAMAFFYSFNPAFAQGACDSIPTSVYLNCPKGAELGTVINNGTYLEDKTGNVQFYHLPYNERVTVNYFVDGHYLVTWKFSDKFDALVGWVEEDKILLDKDVIQ
jgi:hypothetical protein